MRRIATALAVVGTALACAVPATAEAITETSYRVTVEGEATYARTDARPAYNGQYTKQVSGAFRWKAVFPRVTFIGFRLGVTSQPTTTLSGLSGREHDTIPTPTGVMTGECSGNAQQGPPGNGLMTGSLRGDGNVGTEDIAVRTLGSAAIALTSCSGIMAGSSSTLSFGGATQAVGDDAFDERFSLPYEAIGMGKIIQIVQPRKITGARCPGHNDATASCVLDWKGTITLDRTGRRKLGPGAGRPDRYDPDVDDAFVPLSAKLSRDGKAASFAVRCPVACSGTAVAYAGRPLARKRFRVRAGRRGRVTLRFGAGARRQIRRAGAVRIVTRIKTAKGVPAVKRSVVVRVTKAAAATDAGTKCSIKTPKAFSLGDVLKRGFPATISCNGPASVTGDVEIDEYSRKVADYIAERYSGGYPGVPARYPYKELKHRFDEAGSVKVRMKLFRYARPILKRFAPFPVEVNLSVEIGNNKWRTVQSLKRPLRR